jgi:hypothetical protein
MKYVISDSQKEVVGKVIQNFIDSELIIVKQLAADEDSELSYDTIHQIENIESIKLFDLDKKDKWIIWVDVYTPRPLYYYDEVLYHISYQLKKHIGPNEIRENKMVITQDFGPGIDY